MGAMDGHMAMSMALLPAWLRLVWVIVLAGVTLVHLWHARSMSGQPRWWHVAHTVMALGMLAMYAAHPMAQRGLDRGEAVVFGVATVVLAVTTAVLRRREDVLNPVWVASCLEMLAMTYMAVIMQLPTDARPTPVTWLVVSYLASQILAWAFGIWDRVPALTPRTQVVSATSPNGTASSAAPPVAETPATRPSVGLPAHYTPAIRVSLAVMAASMAYMLAVM